MNDIKAQIWNFIQQLNRCWTQNDHSKLNELSKFFHPDMVAVTASDRQRRTGKKNCVDGWTWFAKNAHIEYWTESDPLIQVYADTAVVNYYYDMSFVMGGSTIRSQGRDTLTLVFQNNQWQVVCDHFSPYPC